MGTGEDPSTECAPVRGAPLEGTNVVTIGVNIPGPVAANRLVELGARVVTVLPPAGDPLQHAVPELFDALHRDQTITHLDLKDQSDRLDMEALLGHADLLLTAHRPKALRRLGLEFTALCERYPGLCQVDIVGYPGAEADTAGHDLTYQAAHGLIVPGQMPTTLVADLSAAERAVTAAFAVLRLRDRDGEGAHMEVAISDAARAAALPMKYGLTAPDGFLGGGYPFYAVYEAAEGHIALASLEPQFRERLVELLDLRATADDLPQLRKELAEAFSRWPAAHWQTWARAHDIPLAALRVPGQHTGWD